TERVDGPTLFSKSGNIRTNIALITAQYANIKLNVSTDLPSSTFITNKLPALSDGDVTISGISSIALFLAPKPFKGKDSLEEAQILQWINLAEHEILPAVLALTDNSAAAKPSQNRARQEILHYLDVLNKVLLTRTYLVGETVTLADVSVVCTLVPVFDRVMDAATRSKSSNVLRWYNTITPQPNVKHVLGETK
ncbi:hypothetical protein DAPPUDRAFT_95675, partial [Daphnia pulex]